jgi:hypothetical protein
MTSLSTTHRIYITDAATQLDRVPATIRMWDRENVLPVALRPSRDERNRRYWTAAQIEEIKQWIIDTKRYPGNGMPWYEPTPAEQEAVRMRMRGSRNLDDDAEDKLVA